MDFHLNTLIDKAKVLLQPGEGIYQRTVRSGFWVFTLRITEQLFGIARLIILARVLTPNDFGLMGIALLALATLETFTQTGFQQALIQKKENISDYLDTAWTVLLIRNIFLCTILFFSAPYIALFFDAPSATGIIQAIGFSLLFGGSGGIGGFVNIGIIYFQKELEFNKQFFWRISGTLTDFIVSVTAALILKNVCALILGLLAGNLVRLFMSYFIYPYRPRFKIDRTKSRELFGFGKWILGSSILAFMLTEGDDILVGKILGTTALGFYQMAYRVSNAPATEITHVISQVTFPAYAKLQDNITGLKGAYLKVLQVTTFLSFPIAGLIFVLAPDFTKIFLGDKWIAIVPTMQILVWWGVIRGLVGVISPLFLSIGRPDILTKMQGIQTILLFILIYPLTNNWHITGTSLAVLSSALTMFFIRNHIFIKIINSNIFEFYKPITIPAILTIINILITISFKNHFANLGDIYIFILSLIVFILISLFLSYIAERFFNYKMKALIKELLSSI